MSDYFAAGYSKPLPLFDRPPDPPTATERFRLTALETRARALLEKQTTVGRDLRRVLRFIVEHQGATDDEIQAGTGLDGNSERPRRVRLVECELVVDTGATRRTRNGRGKPATVWGLNRAVMPASVLWMLEHLDAEAAEKGQKGIGD